jgi:hypothetical protein
MAQRGRPKKVQTVVETKLTPAYYEKVLEQREEEQQVQLETLYKELANLKDKIGDALRHVALMDESETVAEAAFRAGRAYGPLSDANDKLEEVLDRMYENNDFDHWDDIFDNF